MSRPALLTLAGVLGAGLLVLTFLAWQRFAPGQTTVTVVGYRVVDDHSIEVRLRVEKDPGATVICTAGAYDRDHVNVGSQMVQVGPSTERSTVVVRSLTTTRRAATAFVTSCSP
jgi:hypothetical protein